MRRREAEELGEHAGEAVQELALGDGARQIAAPGAVDFAAHVFAGRAPREADKRGAVVVGVGGVGGGASGGGFGGGQGGATVDDVD